MAIADKLTALNTTKQAIKTAIENKGQDTTAVPFTDYPSLIDSITTGGTPDWTYQRPLDWLPLPENELNVTRVSMLSLVSELDPTIYIHNVNATGTMIDWGDGTIEPVVTGSQSHTYNTSLLPSINGYGEGQKQVLIKLLGGAITQLHFTTTANWAHIPNTVDLLELNINAPDLTSLLVSANVSMTGGLGTGAHRRARYLKCFKLGQNSLTSIASLLTYARSLEYVKFEHGALNNVTSLVRAFEVADRLKRIDGLSAPLATSVESMCSSCNNLEIVEGEGFPLANILTRAFTNCFELKRAFSEQTGVFQHIGTNESGTIVFQFCTSNAYQIKEVIVNLPSGKNVNGFEAFRGSYAKKITFINPINITDSRSMFWTTAKLKEVNLTLVNALPSDRTNLLGYSDIETLPNWFTFDGASNITQIFQASVNIIEIPDMTFSTSLSMFRAFQNMTSLIRSPNITLLGDAVITNGDSMFNGSANLQVLGSLDVSKVMANFAGSFAGFTSLVEVNYFNIDKSMNFAYCPLSGAELNKIFNNLLPVTGQTITITGTAGRLECDTTIATNKGWTVVQ